MRKLVDSWHGRLEELGNGKRFSRPEGVPGVIRVGLVKASLTPAGLFALRTGFLPSERDLALLRSLAGLQVWSGRVWRFGSEGFVLQANGLVLGRFRKCGLCVRGRRRRGSKGNSFRASRKGLTFANEMADRFGPGWWREDGCCLRDRPAAAGVGGRFDG